MMTMKPGIIFFVPGTPPTKQNFDPGHRKPERVKVWEEAVGWAAKQAIMKIPEFEILSGPVRCELVIYLPDRRKRDIDNLSKAILDSCNGILWNDDNQIIDLHLFKKYDKDDPGVEISAWEIESEETK